MTIYLRDEFGNRNLEVLNYYDASSANAFSVSIYPENPGKDPILISGIYPVPAIDSDDGFVTLIAPIRLTESGYYRARLQLLNDADIPCSGCFFHIQPLEG